MSSFQSNPMTILHQQGIDDTISIPLASSDICPDLDQTPRLSIPEGRQIQLPLQRQKFEISELGSWKGNPTRPQHIPTTTTIAFQNVHGLHSIKSPLETTIQELVYNMDQHNISILGVSEHHISLTNATWRRRLSQGIQRSRPGRISRQFDSGPEHDPTGHLMGGTGILAIDDITGRIEPGGRGGDAMGRWSFMHLRRYRSPPITIISVYQVCKQPTNLIGNTAWHQQRRFLDMHTRPDHPRVAFINDLELFIHTLKHQGHSIIVGGDWNDWLDSPSSSLLKLCTSLQLVDPWALKHSAELDFATYEKGTHRIDSVLVSSDIQHTITKVRYSPVGLFCTTDHRAAIVEFDTNALFGSPTQALPSHSSRSLLSKDRQSVEKFINHMYNHLLHNNAFERSHKLDQNEPNDHHLVEQLDHLIGEAGKAGEAKCRQRRPQWYSTPLVKCRQTVSLLRHHLNGLKSRIDRSQVVQQRLLNIGVNIPMSMEISVVKNQVHEYESRLREFSKTHESIRQEQMSASAATALQSGHVIKAQAIQSISKSEQHLRTWKILQFMDSSENTSRLDRLEIPESWPDIIDQPITANIDLEDPKSATSWKTVVDPKAIEHYLMIRNYQHFGQSQGTPFTVSPLGDDIDWTASSESSEEILHGSYTQKDNITELCKSLLDQCKRSYHDDSIKAELSESDFEGKITSWNERTTTSPSGRHLGWYKALYAEGGCDMNAMQRERFLQKQKAIRAVIIRIMNYCINTGYPLQRWCNIVNTMIFKDPGVYKVHRLRVIHIFEADLNLLYAIKWRQLVRSVDKVNGIHSGQYGGRPGVEATSMALMEELRIDTTYLTRRTLITFDNDAASCYDRIVINLASLVNRKNGMPHKITQLHGTILQKARYKIRTSLGVSEIEYQNHPSKPLYGTGQGAGNSPGIWLLISNLLFEVFDSQSFGACFVTADGKETVRLGLSGFVDDTNAVTNMLHAQGEPCIELMIQRMQHDAQLWSELLHISGGKLELQKCSYQILKFDFQPNGTPVISQQHHPPLPLTDPATGVIHEVPYLATNRAHRILGHWKAPADRRQLEQLRAITSKVDKISLLLAASPITRSGALLGYQGKYMAYLRYVLPQCWFNNATLRKSEQKSMARIISKCGCAKTTPHAIMYAPFELAGAGFVHWSTIQGTGQIKNFIKHWRTNTDTSKMLRVAVSWAQWQAGISRSIFQKVSEPLPHLEGRWIPSLRSFLASIHGSFHLDNDFVASSEREGDRHIMDLAMSFRDFSSDDLKIINYCRLYLHVTTVAELCDATGKFMMRNMFECRRPSWFDKRTITVLQRRPSAYQQQYQWKRFCRRLCTNDLCLGTAWNLGEWKVPGGSLRQRREAYLQHGITPMVYIWHNDQYWTTAPYGVRVTQVELNEATQWTPTDNCFPIDVQSLSPRRFLVQAPVHTHLLSNSSLTPAPTFSEYIEQTPQWAQPFLHNIHWYKEPFELMHFLVNQAMQEQLLLVSDGSCNDGDSMSYGVVIGTSNGTRLLAANGRATGPISSHRAECFGCLAGGLIMLSIGRFTGMNLPSTMEIKVLSDNQGMIRRLQQRKQYVIGYANTTLEPDWDIVEEIHQTYTSLHHKLYVYEWVRGHQDNGGSTVLTIEARYNIAADQLAGEYYIMNGRSPTPWATLLPHTKCVFRIADRDIQGHYESHIRRAAAELSFRTYLQKRHGWTQVTYDDVDWASFISATSNFEGNKIHLMKLVHDKLPTNVVKARYHEYTSAACHFCTCSDTFNHLCTSTCNARSRSFRTHILQEMTDFMYANTPRKFALTFLSALQAWLDGDDSEEPHGWEGPQVLRRKQQRIGWPLMFRGFLTKSWARYLIRTMRAHQVQTWLHANEYPAGGRHHAPTEVHNPYIPDKFIRHPISPTRLFSRVIRKIWLLMGNLWRDHLAHLHEASQRASPIHRLELQSQVRALHSLKDQTLAAHREQYFHPNVDQFLDQATNLQMRRYVTRYRPVILHSVSLANKTATTTRLLPTFFPRRHGIQPRPLMLHPSQEEPPHRKHSRRRIPIVRRITDFFHRSTGHPTTNSDDQPP